MDRIGCFFMTARTFGDLESRILAAEGLGYEAAGLPQPLLKRCAVPCG